MNLQEVMEQFANRIAREYPAVDLEQSGPKIYEQLSAMNIFLEDVNPQNLFAAFAALYLEKQLPVKRAKVVAEKLAEYGVKSAASIGDILKSRR